MADPRNFLFSTDYPTDKVVLLKSGSITINDQSDPITVPHGLSFTPWVNGVFSSTADFSGDVFPFGVGPIVSVQTGVSTWSPMPTILSIAADATNIYFMPDRNLYSRTFYYRVYGFADENADVDAQPTANQADVFAFNTDYNYCKLKQSGTADVSGGDVVVTHGLGYLPQVDVWQSAPNSVTGVGTVVQKAVVSRHIVDYPTAYSNWFELTNQALIFRRGSLPSSGTNMFYYRIYYDEN